MSMNTDLKGRLRNTKLPKTSGLIPLFEAVVNSIHSIEEAQLAPDAGKITIKIIRSNELDLDTDKSIVGFEVTDNGVGFNDKNMDSFKTLDSQYKRDKGCRGIGRLMWLLAFNSINIKSIYRDGGDKLQKISFSFNNDNGVDNLEMEEVPNSNIETTLYLSGFIEKYQSATAKKSDSIANSLVEHCLWYFIREGGAPEITITDGTEIISLADIYEKYMLESTPEQISIGEHIFELTHVRLHTHSSQSHVIAYCASNRLVKDISLNGKIPGLFGRIKDNENSDVDFVYACYVSSPYLDDNVRAERTGFDIDENLDGLLPNSDISLNTITQTVIEKVSNYLDKYLTENKKQGRDRIEEFIAKKAPRFRPILSRIPDNELYIDPNIDDKKLELMLHEHLYNIEIEHLSKGHDIMNPVINETPETYQKKLQEYLEITNDIKKSDLANYVSHRKIILDLLEQYLTRQDDGKYVREDLIHRLIMPMGKDSNQLTFDSCNLWLIDERLAFHNYLGSDKTLNSMPITGSTSNKEPDLCALIYNNPILVSESNKLPLASIVVVEIKRPMRNDASEGEENDPIEQVLGYLERIRQGQVQTANGRQIPKSESIPGFCYIICDITPTIQKRCKMHDLIATSDGLGYFSYQKNYQAYVEVISFDRLINAAKERNRAFFDKLGLPTT